MGLPKDLASPKSPIFNTPLSSINKLFGFKSYKKNITFIITEQLINHNFFHLIKLDSLEFHTLLSLSDSMTFRDLFYDLSEFSMTNVKQLLSRYCHINLLFKVFMHTMMHKTCASVFFLLELKSVF